MTYNTSSEFKCDLCGTTKVDQTDEGLLPTNWHGVAIETWDRVHGPNQYFKKHLCPTCYKKYMDHEERRWGRDEQYNLGEIVCNVVIDKLNITKKQRDDLVQTLIYSAMRQSPVSVDYSQNPGDPLLFCFKCRCSVGRVIQLQKGICPNCGWKPESEPEAK